jgi:hypothetical protein
LLDELGVGKGADFDGVEHVDVRKVLISPGVLRVGPEIALEIVDCCL